MFSSSLFLNVVPLFFRGTVEGFARECEKALRGAGTNNTALMRLMTLNSPKQLKAIGGKYKDIHGRDMKDDVEKDLSGWYGQFVAKRLDANN